MKKANFYSTSISIVLLLYCRTDLCGNIWLELESEPEPKINNFGSATLILRPAFDFVR